MDERELEKILDKLESARGVRVVIESVAHGENYIDAFGNLKTVAVFDDFLVIEIDGEEFTFKIESDEDDERAEEISDRIHEKIADIVAEKVEEQFQVDEWDGCCDFFQSYLSPCLTQEWKRGKTLSNYFQSYLSPCLTC